MILGLPVLQLVGINYDLYVKCHTFFYCLSLYLRIGGVNSSISVYAREDSRLSSTLEIQLISILNKKR